MNPNDQDPILSVFRKKEPSDLQMQKWKRAVKREAGILKGSHASNGKKRVFEWIAASLVGFAMGGLLFSSLQRESPLTRIAEYQQDDATIEYVRIKMD